MSTILIVDDDPDIRLLLRLELVAEGYDVVTANDGQQALDSIAASSPDLVLLDVMMPVLDGWGVLAALDHEVAPPVIVISGIGADRGAHISHALERGAVDFVGKPFEPAALGALVARVLARSKDELEAERLSRLQTL
jgi:DNA-binding response OmpR family regulator